MDQPEKLLAALGVPRDYCLYDNLKLLLDNWLADVDPNADCDKCGGHGSLLGIHKIGASWEAVTCLCECSKARRAEEEFHVRLTAAGIPERYKGATIEAWSSQADIPAQEGINAASIAKVRGYNAELGRMRSEGHGMFLNGPNGTGKTYLAVATALNALRLGYTVYYFTVSRFVTTMLDSMGFNDDDKRSMREKIELADFVVVDDLDKAYKTTKGIEVSLFDSVLRERVQNNRPLLVTSNTKLDQVVESHGPSVASMLTEHCVDVVILGRDHRTVLAKSRDLSG